MNEFFLPNSMTCYCYFSYTLLEKPGKPREKTNRCVWFGEGRLSKLDQRSMDEEIVTVNETLSQKSK